MILKTLGRYTLGLALLSTLGCGALPGAKPSIDVEELTLKNGMTVLLSRDTRSPMVAVEVRYKVGSSAEAPGKTGFAHLFEHLMFQGSAGCNDEYFKPFAALGGQVNGTTNTDRTNYFEQVPSRALERALFMEADRMRSLPSALTQEKLDNQRDVVKNERRQRYENTPYGAIWKLLAQALYPEGHPYHHDTIGSHADLTAASLEDAKAFFKTHYAPNNAILAIVGDFDRDTAFALVQQHFGSIPAGNPPPAPNPAPVVAKPQHVVETDDVKLPRIYLAWHTPALLAEGDSAMDVLASVLSEGKSSRLHKVLVYEKKVAQQVAAYQVSRALGSFFVVQATAAPGQSIETLARELMPALEKALSTPPTQQELTRALNGWKKSFYSRVESILSRAHLLTGYAHLAGSADYIRADLARYTELTADDIHTVAQQWMRSDVMVRVDIEPEKPAAPKAPAGDVSAAEVSP